MSRSRLPPCDLTSVNARKLPGISLARSAICYALILLHSLAYADPREAGEWVVVPVPRLTIDQPGCYEWSASVTYVATSMPRAILDQLSDVHGFSVNDHFHVTGPGMGEWDTNIYVGGNPANKLAKINETLFGVRKPEIGRRSINYHVFHVGECAADAGVRECVGLFVNPLLGTHYGSEPRTFPQGMCAGIPPSSASCKFASPSGSISLGTGGRGRRVGSTNISVSCTQPVVYRVMELPGSADPDSLRIVNLTVEGRPLPYLSQGNHAAESLSIEVEATVSSEGFLSTNRVLWIDIP